jgi:hypothetical protein
VPLAKPLKLKSPFEAVVVEDVDEPVILIVTLSRSLPVPYTVTVPEIV